MTIGIINPGSGNITSLCDAVERLGASYRVLSEPDLNGLDQIVIPGQGRFGAVMRFMEQHGWTTALREWHAHEKPLLGICVGMQILFESSEEDPGVPGLGLVSGRIERLDAPKRPMMGWAQVRWSDPGFSDGAAYFVNGFVAKTSPLRIAVTDYGQPFCAAVAQKNLMGFQFHPEKSGTWGKELLARCLIY